MRNGLVEGVSLRAVLRESGAMAPEAAASVLAGTLLTLAVGHGDVRPENVLVDASGGLTVTGFGGPDPEFVPDEPAYLAPERLAGGPATPAADVFAATAVFFECLTAEPPFRAATPEDLNALHEYTQVIAEFAPDGLRPLIQHGLAADPTDRPESAHAFLQEVDAAVTAAYGPDWQSRGRALLGGWATAAASADGAELTGLDEMPEPPPVGEPIDERLLGLAGDEDATGSEDAAAQLDEVSSGEGVEVAAEEEGSFAEAEAFAVEDQPDAGAFIAVAAEEEESLAEAEAFAIEDQPDAGAFIAVPDDAAEVEPEPDAVAEADTAAYTEAEPEPDVAADADARPDTVAADAEFAFDAESSPLTSEPEPEVALATEAEPEPDAVAYTDVEPGPDDADADAGPGTVAADAEFAFDAESSSLASEAEPEAALATEDLLSAFDELAPHIDELAPHIEEVGEPVAEPAADASVEPDSELPPGPELAPDPEPAAEAEPAPDPEPAPATTLLLDTAAEQTTKIVVPPPSVEPLVPPSVQADIDHDWVFPSKPVAQAPRPLSAYANSLPSLPRPAAEKPAEPVATSAPDDWFRPGAAEPVDRGPRAARQTAFLDPDKEKTAVAPTGYDGDFDDAEPDDEQVDPGGPRRKTLVGAVTAAVLLVAGAAAVVLGGSGDSGPAPAAQSSSEATPGTPTSTDSVPGTPTGTGDSSTLQTSSAGAPTTRHTSARTTSKNTKPTGTGSTSSTHSSSSSSSPSQTSTSSGSSSSSSSSSSAPSTTPSGGTSTPTDTSSTPGHHTSTPTKNPTTH